MIAARLAGLIVLLALSFQPSAGLGQTPRFDVARLMQLLGRAPAAEVAYTELKYSSLLTKPVASSGTLSFRRPDIVEKNMLSPRRERFRIAGQELVVERNGAEHRVPLGSQPLLSAFAASLRGVLAGDAALLGTFYRLALEGDEQAWQLDMLPLEMDLGRYVERITVSGRGGRIGQIEVREASGDRSVMLVR